MKPIARKWRPTLMGEAAERVYEALADAGFDVLTRLGPR
jgi:hypothetical protein